MGEITTLDPRKAERISKSLFHAAHPETGDVEAVAGIRAARRLCETEGYDLMEVIGLATMMPKGQASALIASLTDLSTPLSTTTKLQSQIEELTTQLVDAKAKIKALSADNKKLSAENAKLKRANGSAEPEEVDDQYQPDANGLYTIDQIEGLYYDLVKNQTKWQTNLYTILGVDQSRFETMKKKGFAQDFVDKMRATLTTDHAVCKVQKTTWSDAERARLIELDAMTDDKTGKRFTEKKMAEILTAEFGRMITRNSVTGERDRSIAKGRMQPRKEKTTGNSAAAQ